MTYNKESFCGTPWHHVVIQPSGEYKFCCLANDDHDGSVAHDHNNVPMNVLTHSWMDAMNSKNFRNVRELYSNNIKPDACKNCYDKEAVAEKSRSRRTGEVVHWQGHRGVPTPDTAPSFTSSDFKVATLPNSLDLRFGNLCNYKCVMCSPKYSSLWAEDWAAINGPESVSLVPGQLTTKLPLIKDQNNRLRVDSLRWWETPQWWERFLEIVTTVERIYFTGGEPFLVPMHEQVLQYLVDHQHAGRITLHYHTNLSIINDNILKLLVHFKSLAIRVSVDDIDDRYHIVRNPGNYRVLIKNIFRLQQKNIPLTDINGCLGLSTIYSPLRLAPLAKKIKTEYFYRFLYAPTNQNLANLPKSAKKEIIAVYQKNLEVSGEAGKAVIKFLEQYMDHEDLDEITSYVKYMDQLDQLRGTDWRTTLLDVYELLQAHCPSAFDKK